VIVDTLAKLICELWVLKSACEHFRQVELAQNHIDQRLGGYRQRPFLEGHQANDIAGNEDLEDLATSVAHDSKGYRPASKQGEQGGRLRSSPEDELARGQAQLRPRDLFILLWRAA